ncbi:MAG: hypothetical protein ACTTKY_07255 [Catonella sp.]
MEGLDRDPLQQELVNCSVGAVLLYGGGFQAADAAPNDGLAAVINSQNKTPRINKIGSGSIILPFTSSNWNLV